MIRLLLGILGIGLVTLQTSHADVVVRIQSDQPARAFLNGALLGNTPLTVSKVKHGSHTIKVENINSGELKIFTLYSPKGATVEKEIDAEFDVASRAVPVPRTTEVVRTTVIAPAVRPAPVVVYQGPPPPPRHHRRAYGPYNYNDDYVAREERQKVRSRNVLLGAAAANEIFNQGSSKGTVRGVTLGGALLNEVLREGR